jgi:hypothetical protein
MGSREPKGSGLQYSKNDRLEPKRSGRYLLLLALNPPASADHAAVRGVFVGSGAGGRRWSLAWFRLTPAGVRGEGAPAGRAQR